jgi:cytidylate kinase
MKSPLHDEPRLTRVAERQMRTWSHGEEHADSSRQGHSKGQKTRIFVTISRQAGAGGSEVAQLVGRELGWQVFDKNLLDCLAERFHESRPILDLVDETRNNWIFDVIGSWLDHKIVPHQKFVAQLRRVVSAVAAEYQHAIFVGRGAQFILPREDVIAVRMTAPVAFRVERMMQTLGLDEAKAKRFVRETDADRAEFVKQFFHQDVNDPRHYDLIIDVRETGLTAARDQIVACVSAKTHGRL